MWANALKFIAKFLLLPLLKDFGDYLLKKYKEHQDQKEKERRIKEAAERSVNEQDQKPIEREISPGKEGKPSGRGEIRNNLPGVK